MRLVAISVPVVGNAVIEFDEAFFVNLSSASGATLTDSQGLGAITNDDFAIISIGDVSIVEGLSGSTLMVFTVSLSAAALTPVSVNYDTADDTAQVGTDYTATTGTLTIPTGQTSAQISVPSASCRERSAETSAPVTVADISPHSVRACRRLSRMNSRV